MYNHLLILLINIRLYTMPFVCLILLTSLYQNNYLSDNQNFITISKLNAHMPFHNVEIGK